MMKLYITPAPHVRAAIGASDRIALTFHRSILQ